MPDEQELRATEQEEERQRLSGAWAGAPALAATGVAMTNTSGQPVWVSVTSGTVTAISINGSATGLTAGTFRVRRNGTLAITYSVAPTVKWYYE